MPRVPDPLDFQLPAEPDTTALWQALGDHLTLAPQRRSSRDRIALDTFDGRLHDEGLTLWRDSRISAGGTIKLTLDDGGEAPLVAAGPVPQPDRVLVADLPTGALRSRVEDAVEERALLTQVRIRTSVEPANVLNDDGKTVARLVVEAPAVVRRGRTAACLGARLRLTPILGYDRAFERVAGVVAGELGLARQTVPVVDEASAAAGLPVGGVSAKVDVALDPTMRTDHATVLVCRRLAEIVEANLPGTIDDTDTEFLHDLRVAVRRTRSVLKEMRDVLPPEAAAQSRADLRWIQEITGPTRDLDVQLHEWPATVAATSPAMAADLVPLRDLLARHRAAAFKTMRRHLRAPRFETAWASWRALLDDPASWQADAGPNASEPIGALAGRRIVSVYKGMVKMGSAIDDDSPPEALHDLRKRGKELRYLLELFGRMWPPATVAPLVSTLKGLQDSLGRFQDDQIQATYLRSLGPELSATPGGTDSLIALGVVIDGLAADQLAARHAFEDRFTPFAAAANRTLVRRTFRW